MCAKSNEDKEAKKAEKAAAKAEKAAAKAAKAKSKPKPKKKQNTGANEYNFFLLHGEKVAIAVAVLIFVGLLAMGSGLEKFTLTAEQINQTSTSAQKNIDDSKITPAEFDSSVVVFDYDKYAELIKSGVKVNAYETPNRWEQSLFPDKNKRPDIVPLPLENLKATASIGAISYNERSASGNNTTGGGNMGGMGGGNMGGGGMGMGTTGELKGRKWITLTGSIPIRKQQIAYNEAFGNAQYLDDVRDQPRYIFYRLERGEVQPNGKVDWKKVDVITAIQKENALWAGVGSDQVGYSYIAPSVPNFPPMAMNCPPMANKPFGEEVANLPNIPLNSTEQIKVQSDVVKEWNELQDEMNKFDEDDLLQRDPFADAQMGGGAGMSAGMNMGGMGGMDMAGGMGMSGGRGGSGGGGMNNANSDNSWMINQNAITASRLRIQQTASVDYYLFRYFDFEVEPDKTYVYRVKLILGNPNYGVEERFVEDPETLKKATIETEFSAPSNPVSLGEVSRVYAENVQATKVGMEPRITVSSVYFDSEDASESIVQGQSMKRGQVANFYSQSHNPVNVAGGMMMDYSTYGAGTGSKKSTKKSVNHVSNVCIVDALGGDKISSESEFNSPGKILILEPNGLMRVREVKEDARELSRYDGSQNQMGFSAGAAGSMM